MGLIQNQNKGNIWQVKSSNFSACGIVPIDTGLQEILHKGQGKILTRRRFWQRTLFLTQKEKFPNFPSVWCVLCMAQSGKFLKVFKVFVLHQVMSTLRKNVLFQ